LRRLLAGWRQVRSQPLKAVLRGLSVLPGPVRSVASRTLATVAPTGGRAAGLRVIAAAAGGRRDEAVAWAETRAAARGTGPATRLSLARAALALDAVPAASRIAAGLPETVAASRTGRGLRAELAWRTGRFTEAIELARDATDPHVVAVGRRAAAELRVLDPSWRPAVRAPSDRPEPAPGTVLHLLTNALPDVTAGYTLRSHAMARAQREAGLDAHVATRAGFPRSAGRRGATADETVDGVPYHRIDPDLDPTALPDAVVEATARGLVRLAERLRPAVLHPASNHLNASAALAAGGALGIPCVYEVRGFLEETWASADAAGLAEGTPETVDRYRLARIAETEAMRRADAVVTLSATMRDEIVSRGIAAQRVTIVPNGVDVERFAPRSRDEALAERLGLGSGEPVVGYVSTFNRYEGIATLIDAVARLRAGGRRVRLLLVGEGREGAALRAQARRLGLVDDGTAIFTGRVPPDAVAAHLSLLDVFVVPRTADRVSQLVTPLKPLEAMAMGIPLLVSATDALVETVGGADRGETFRPEDATDLAHGLERLLDDPQRRRALGGAGRRWVAAERTWRRNAERYVELYASLGVTAAR
jgi:glycosyltransferase involved in cell wall biosynthesis